MIYYYQTKKKNIFNDITEMLMENNIAYKTCREGQKHCIYLEDTNEAEDIRAANLLLTGYLSLTKIPNVERKYRMKLLMLEGSVILFVSLFLAVLLNFH